MNHSTRKRARHYFSVVCAALKSGSFIDHRSPRFDNLILHPHRDVLRFNTLMNSE